MQATLERGEASEETIFVFHGAAEATELAKALHALVSTSRRAAFKLICVSSGDERLRDSVQPHSSAHVHGYRFIPGQDEGFGALCSALRSLEVQRAHALVVLPDRSLDEPDSRSRVLCKALREVCDGVLPNTVVEIADPEAALEFRNLGVATVLSAGFLQATLIAHACVDLGVYRLLDAMLSGRYHVRAMAVPDRLRGATFGEAAIELDEDGGRAITVVGVQHGSGSDGNARVQLNPSPRLRLSAIAALMILEAT